MTTGIQPCSLFVMMCLPSRFQLQIPSSHDCLGNELDRAMPTLSCMQRQPLSNCLVWLSLTHSYQIAFSLLNGCYIWKFIFQKCCFVHWLSPFTSAPAPKTQPVTHALGWTLRFSTCFSTFISLCCPSGICPVQVVGPLSFGHKSNFPTSLCLLILPFFKAELKSSFLGKSSPTFTVSSALVKARCLSTTKLALDVHESPSFVEAVNWAVLPPGQQRLRLSFWGTFQCVATTVMCSSHNSNANEKLYY